mmetsp:Transcript_75796/g.181226  ORF Transcript_75796/g.181226 Transcript_75796/m.181226 type:complete len:202 (-) Transcript_75796:841-1446(-)
MCDIHANREKHGHHEDLGAEMKVAKIPQSQRSQKGSRRQQASEVAHSPRAPSIHPRQEPEDDTKHQWREEANQQREASYLRRLPAIERPPVGVSLRRVGGRHVQHFRHEEQDEGLVGDPLQHAGGGKDVGRVALRSLEEKHCRAQRYYKNHVAVHEFQACVAQVHCDPPDARSQAFQSTDPSRGNLEAPVEVLVEVPHNEQ